MAMPKRTKGDSIKPRISLKHAPALRALADLARVSHGPEVMKAASLIYQFAAWLESDKQRLHREYVKQKTREFREAKALADAGQVVPRRGRPRKDAPAQETSP